MAHSTGDRPAPRSAEDRARWKYTALVHRMLTGRWSDDARHRLQSLFDRSVWPSLAPPETSRNAALSITSQRAQLLYMEPPEVTAEGTEDISAIETTRLWPLRSRCLFFTAGMNEALMRVDWHESTGTTYRVVTPDYVCAIASSEQPDIPVMLEELRWRDGHGWTWEVWDIRDPEDPRFRIEAEGERGRVDVTRDVLGDDYTGQYPYRDRSGAPVMPYVLYHAAVGNSLWTPYRGSEVFHGTLTVAALYTMWITGFRDGAHPQRVVVDGEIVGGVVTAGGTAGGSSGVKQIALSQTSILPVRSLGDRQAGIDQWAPAMEPESAAKSLESIETGLAAHAGVDPADVQRGSANQSGYSVVVKRDGQRKAAKQLEAPSRMGDQLLLATAARIHNASAGGNLPEEPDAYSIAYHQPGKSPDEIRASIEGMRALLDEHLITPAEAYRKHHPGVTDEMAIEAMIESARQKQLIARAIAPEPVADPGAAEEPDTTTTEG